ncbi:MAG: ATP-binding protein [Opitutales bacterium]|nr:ATP-binding protein [Opitutales bacterium]
MARYKGHLSSYDTWTRTLRPLDWSRLKRADKWLARLRSLVSEIDGGAVVEKFYPELPIVQYALALYQRLQGTTSDRRAAWLIGPTGIGKTAACRYIARQNPKDATYIKVDSTMRDSGLNICIGIAKALGCTYYSHSLGKTFRAITEHLKAHHQTIIVDEAHEGGVSLLKMIKTWIDETPARFLITTWPSAWAKLITGNTESYSEAQQLLGRSIKPVLRAWSHGLRIDDITAYLRADTPLADDAPALATRLHGTVRTLGYRALVDAIEAARDEADQSDSELTSKLIYDLTQEVADVSL